MKFLNTNLIKILLITLLVILLIGYIIYLINNSADREVQNGFVKKHNIELNSLDISDE